jgi:hypothetical protein
VGDASAHLVPRAEFHGAGISFGDDKEHDGTWPMRQDLLGQSLKSREGRCEAYARDACSA